MPREVSPLSLSLSLSLSRLGRGDAGLHNSASNQDGIDRGGRPARCSRVNQRIIKTERRELARVSASGARADDRAAKRTSSERDVRANVSIDLIFPFPRARRAPSENRVLSHLPFRERQVARSSYDLRLVTVSE